MEQIKTVFVDCDGVLYDSACLTYEQMVEGCQRAGMEFGIDWTQAVKVHDDLKAKGIHGLYNTTLVLCQNYNVPFNKIAEKMTSYVDYSAIPQDMELLDLLKRVSKKRKLSIYTNNTLAHLNQVFQRLFGLTVEQTGIQAITAESTLWDNFFHVKEYTNAFTVMCQRLQSQPNETILLDDTLGVINSAKNQGLQATQSVGSKMTKEILKGLL